MAPRVHNPVELPPDRYEYPFPFKLLIILLQKDAHSPCPTPEADERTLQRRVMSRNRNQEIQNECQSTHGQGLGAHVVSVRPESG
jgi:hypothetical protein